MEDSPRPPQSRLLKLSLVITAGQAGCITVVIVFAALAVGLWLDSQIGHRGLCTLGMVILSIPLSLGLMLKLALRAANRLGPTLSEPEPTLKED